MGTLGLEVEKGLFLGIDFGTTNSVVSIYNYDNDEIITLSIDGHKLFPTVIQFDSSYEAQGQLETYFGSQAKEAAVIYPESTVLGIKRLLSTDDGITIVVDEQHYTFHAEDIVARILSYLKEQADIYLREELFILGEFTGCVITVPANSTDKQKRRTKNAAIKAGFTQEQVFLRFEPSAAAITYAAKANESKRVFIYDFGGGTFDACILGIDCKEEEPAMTILSTYGDNYLGGDDIDAIMMDMLYTHFREQTHQSIDLFDLNANDGISIKQKKMAILRLKQVATVAKERLTTTNTTKVVLSPFIQEPEIVNIQMEITREAFYSHKRQYQLNDPEHIYEKMKGKTVIDLITKTLTCTKNCLQAAELTIEDIDAIFLVGGSSSIPEVKKQLTAFFNKEPYASKISPAFSISQGAAYYCNLIMRSHIHGPKVIEQTIHPLGLEIAGRRFMEIIGRGREIGENGLEIEAAELLETNFDGITSMPIILYEDTALGDDKGIKFVYQDGMKRLGSTILHGIPEDKKGIQKVHVTFHIDQDNILTVKAKSTSSEGVETTLAVDALY